MFGDSQAISKRQRSFLGRALVLVLVGLAATGLLVSRISYLTLGRGEQLYRLSEENFLSRESISAPRGTISDRHGRLIATTEPRFHASVSPFRITSATLASTMDALRRLSPRVEAVSVEEVMGLYPKWERKRVAAYMTLDEALPLMERLAALPGLQIEQDFQRHYVRGRATAQITGYVGAIPPRAWPSYRERGYAPDDMVGLTGMERKYEYYLSGRKGEQIVRRDARGRVLQRLYVDDDSKAVPGARMSLALDIDLQTTVTSMLAPHSGSIVVMDPRNGDVLAIASSPGYDANHPQNIGKDGDSSYFKAIRSHSAPGSTFKLVTAAAYLLAGGSPDRRIHCSGKLEIAPEFYMYCDARSGHGPLDLRQALRYSCNVYFYQLAMELPLERLIDTARMFGFGGRTGVGITTHGEAAGRLGRSRGRPPLADKVMMAIGQGQLISATPIQLAVAYCTLANGGTRYAPRIVLRTEMPNGETIDYPPSPQGQPIPWTNAQRMTIVEGLHDAVNAPYGTARHADFAPEVGPLVAGKTGTAQRRTAQGMVADAWFVCFMPWRDPEVCIVVLLEEAGHGGEEAAPLAKHVLREYLRLKERRGVPVPSVEGLRVASERGG